MATAKKKTSKGTVKTYTTMTDVKKLYQQKAKTASNKVRDAGKKLDKDSKNLELAKASYMSLPSSTSSKTRAKKKAYITNLQKTVNIDNTKLKKAKTSEDKADSDVKRYKKSREASEVYTKKILTKMKKSKYWKQKRGYLMPKYPWATTSYVFVRINDEAPTSSNPSTSNPVEKGFISAGNQRQPVSLSLSGVLGGDGGNSHMAGLKTQVKRLKRWSDNGTLLVWHGETTLKSCTISDFTPDFSHDPGTGGENIVNISMTIEEMSYGDSNTKTKKKVAKDTGSKPTTKRSTKTTKKRYIVTKKGYTYSFIAKKTGVSVGTLEKKNKYAATKIPIGVKIYY